MGNSRNTLSGRRRLRTNIIVPQNGLKNPDDNKIYADWIETADHRDILLPRLGWCQIAIFLAIYDLGRSAYGAKIIEWFEARGTNSDEKVNKGQIYGTLGELAEEGLIFATQVPPPTGRGRKVIVYSMSPLGRVALKMCLMWLRARSDKGADDTSSLLAHRAPRRQ